MFEGVNATYSRYSSESVETAYVFTPLETCPCFTCENNCYYFAGFNYSGWAARSGLFSEVFSPSRGQHVQSSLNWILTLPSIWSVGNIAKCSKSIMFTRGCRVSIMLTTLFGHRDKWMCYMILCSWSVALLLAGSALCYDSDLTVVSLSPLSACRINATKATIILHYLAICTFVRWGGAHCTELPKVVCRPTSVPLDRDSFATALYITSSSLLSVLRFYSDCLFPFPLSSEGWLGSLRGRRVLR